MYFKFGPNDIIKNQIKAAPNINIKIYDRNLYLNNHSRQSGSFVSNVGIVPTGYIDLYQNNIDRPVGQRIYPFLIKNGSLTSLRGVSQTSFHTNYNYGDIVSGSYPLSASISLDRFTTNSSRRHIEALRNHLNRARLLSPHFAYSSSLGDKSAQELRLISIPSIFYGSSIQKGSISLSFYCTGTLAAQLVDENQNGELRQKLPADTNSGSVAGVALYKEGFLILTSSWSIHPVYTDNFDVFNPSTLSAPRWIDFGTTGTVPFLNDGTNVPSSSFELNFNGTNYIPVITMFAHAPKNELNFSNNQSFIAFGQTGSTSPLTGSFIYKEKDDLLLRNLVKTPFNEPTGSFVQTVYITKVGLFDKNKNLIGVVKLSQPVRKRINEGISIKIKYDLG